MLFLYNEVLRELPEFTTKYSFVDQIVHFEFSQSGLIFDARLLPIFYDVYISLSFADRDCVRAAFAAVEGAKPIFFYFILLKMRKCRQGRGQRAPRPHLP